MKHSFLIVGLLFTSSVCAVGPSLGKATSVLVMGNSTETPNAICKGFMLTSMEAEAFIYYAAVVTFREVHDHYDVPPCSVYGKSLFHGYPATWEIKASGTGSISLLSGERF